MKGGRERQTFFSHYYILVCHSLKSCLAEVVVTPQLWLESKRCDTAAVFVSAGLRAGFRCQSAEPVSHRSETLRLSNAVGKTKPAARYDRTINNHWWNSVWRSSPQWRRWSVWSPTLIYAESPRSAGASLLSASRLTNYVFDTTSAGSCARVTSNARNLSEQTPNSGSNLLHHGATFQAVCGSAGITDNTAEPSPIIGANRTLEK